MQIKKAIIRDAQAMHRIHTKAVSTTCKNFYTKKQIAAWLEGRSPEGYHEGIQKGEMYVAEDKGEIVGFGHAIPGEVVAVFVDPDFHNQGIGKLLLEYGLRIASKDHQKIKVKSTLNAENFYKKQGFIKVKEDISIKKGEKLSIVILEFLVQ
ncbi:MAG: GNAT family N-acetyltransferase [Candidatus Gracilibacteria bacterium]